MGERPSILSQSPHGLHPFSFLTYPVPEILLIDRLQQLLAGIPVEIKPTHSVGMRIPSAASLLDPRTCYLKAGTTNTVLGELIPRYRSLGLSEHDAAANFAALFAPDYTGELRVSLEQHII